MKKILILFTICIITACTKEVQISNETQPIEFKTILEFENFEQLQQKAKFINELQNDLEKELFSNDFNEQDLPTNNKAANLSVEALLEHIDYNYKQKLSITQKIRNELNFKSLKSITEEINYLSISNPEKAEILITEHKDFITKNEYGYYPKVDQNIASVINSDGEVIIAGEKVNLIENTNVLNRNLFSDNYISFKKYEKEYPMSSDVSFIISYSAGVAENSVFEEAASGIDFLYTEASLVLKYKGKKHDIKIASIPHKDSRFEIIGGTGSVCHGTIGVTAPHSVPFKNGNDNSSNVRYKLEIRSECSPFYKSLLGIKSNSKLIVGGDMYFFDTKKREFVFFRNTPLTTVN